MKVKHYELVDIAKDFLQNYNLELKIPIEFNTRLKKVLGRFVFNRRTGPIKIEMSIDFIMSHPREHIIDVLKHELVHYALYVLGRPYDDGHPVFEGELKKHGIKSTHSYQYLGELHEYECINCKKIYHRKRKLVSSAYCQCSKGPNLNYNGLIQKKMENMVAFQSE